MPSTITTCRSVAAGAPRHDAHHATRHQRIHLAVQRGRTRRVAQRSCGHTSRPKTTDSPSMVRRWTTLSRWLASSRRSPSVARVDSPPSTASLLVDLAVEQQVNGENSEGKLFTRKTPSRSLTPDQTANPNMQNCPPPPSCREEPASSNNHGRQCIDG